MKMIAFRSWKGPSGPMKNWEKRKRKESYWNLWKETEDKFKVDDKERVKFVVKAGKKFSNCKEYNIGYSIKCKLCKSRNITKSYEGESLKICISELLKMLDF